MSRKPKLFKKLTIAAFLLSLLLLPEFLIAQTDSLNKKPLAGIHNYCRFEVSIGIGTKSSDEMFDGYHGPFPNINDYSVNQYSGAYCLTFRYAISPKVSIGIGIAYENESGDMLENVPYSRNQFMTNTIGSFKRQAFTLAPEIKINYSTTKYCKVYGYIGFGVTLENESDAYLTDYYSQFYFNGKNSLGPNIQFTDNKFHFNGQITPLGMEIGGRVRWFVELGLGYKGIANTGVLIKLH